MCTSIRSVLYLFGLNFVMCNGIMGIYSVLGYSIRNRGFLSGADSCCLALNETTDPSPSKQLVSSPTITARECIMSNRVDYSLFHGAAAAAAESPNICSCKFCYMLLS